MNRTSSFDPSIDSCSEIVGSRLKDILHGTFHTDEDGKSNTVSVEEYLERFHHFTTPSLPYLLALLTHQTSSFPPEETTLIVVDSISTLFALAFPKTTENASSQQTSVKQSDAAHWASGRRWAVMGDLISKISRLAATKNLAVLLTSQMTTRIKSETGAVLNPAISGTAWDTGVSARIVIFRDWMFRASEDTSSQGEYIPGVRCAGLVKAKGMSYEGVGKVVTFVIENVSSTYHRTGPFLIDTDLSSGNCSKSNRHQNKQIACHTCYIVEAQKRRNCRQ